MLEMLRNREIDGIMILSSAVTPKILKLTVLMGRLFVVDDAGERLFSSIYINHAEAFRSAMQYLMERGHRRIGFTVGRLDSPKHESASSRVWRISQRNRGALPRGVDP